MSLPHHCNYVAGKPSEGRGRETLINPSTEEAIATTCAQSPLLEAVEHARNVAGPALRRLTFAQRAEKLKALIEVIVKHREALLDLSVRCGGNTRGDAKFDIDGGTATLQYFAALGASLGSGSYLAEHEPLQLARNPRWVGQHVWVPQDGVALHINAFNFPAWNLLEKAAVSLLSGVPVITKPASPGSSVAALMFDEFYRAGLLSDGSFQLVHGSVADELNVLGVNDSIAFTGSSRTASLLRRHEAICERGVRLNVEADSLNAVVLGPDVEESGETMRAFLRDVVREITQKAGQKCTAFRRILVPAALRSMVESELAAALDALNVGDPSAEGVKVGPLASGAQKKSVTEGLTALLAESKQCTKNRTFEKGYFVAPTLLSASASSTLVHEREVFGPVATVLGYSGNAEEAAVLIKRGRGSLQTSVYSDDSEWVDALFHQASAWQGRFYWGSEKVSEHAVQPGAVLASLNHGGPGRAGGGSELGGIEALKHSMQRVAVQGSRPLLQKLLGHAVLAPAVANSSSSGGNKESSSSEGARS